MRIVNYTTTFIDYPCNDDWAVIIYCSGCCHHCFDCHNKILQDSSKGKLVTVDDLYELISKETKKSKTKKVVFSGGDPLFESNLDTVRNFLNLYGKEFEITIYTGYNIDYVKTLDIKNFRFIKCGKYDRNLKQPSGNFETYFQLASTNQNFYDVNFKQLSKDGRLTYYEISTEN